MSARVYILPYVLHVPNATATITSTAPKWYQNKAYMGYLISPNGCYDVMQQRRDVHHNVNTVLPGQMPPGPRGIPVVSVPCRGRGPLLLSPTHPVIRKWILRLTSSSAPETEASASGTSPTVPAAPGEPTSTAGRVLSLEVSIFLCLSRLFFLGPLSLLHISSECNRSIQHETEKRYFTQSVSVKSS